MHNSFVFAMHNPFVFIMHNSLSCAFHAASISIVKAFGLKPSSHLSAMAEAMHVKKPAYACDRDLDPSSFKRSKHLQINTATHVLCKAWQGSMHRPDLSILVYEEWVYEDEVDRVNDEISEKFRASGELHFFSCQCHTLDFRWSCK